MTSGFATASCTFGSGRGRYYTKWFRFSRTGGFKTDCTVGGEAGPAVSGASVKDTTTRLPYRQWGRPLLFW